MATLISFNDIREFCEKVCMIICRVYIIDFDTKEISEALTTCAGVDELINFLRENNLYTQYGETKGHLLDMFTEDEEIYEAITT